MTTPDGTVLGAQTATVIAQARQGDGARAAHPGCSLQPLGDSAETVDRGVTTTTRWRLFAPPGFRARSTDEVEVTPGPETDQGTPARLRIVGDPQSWPDEDGAEHHVTAVLARTTGRGR